MPEGWAKQRRPRWKVRQIMAASPGCGEFRRMDSLTFAAAALSLLATPGPTNTLLATSGAEVGLRRSLPLLGAELGGYLLAILLLRALIGPLMAANPLFAAALHGAVVVYLLYL